ncbi:MAG: hypothetical protein M3R50_00700 [Bacteroidota bacterium]|nr:hypothetical protein [Bacteroidota bacterium]
MKKSIQIFAIAILFGTSAFAKGIKPVTEKTTSRDSVYFNALKDNSGINIGVNKQVAGYTIVSLYDEHKNLILSQHLPKKLRVEQKYILGDSGTYYFVVESKDQKVEKKITVSYPTQETIDISN